MKDYLISYNLTFVCLYKCVCLLFLNFDIVFRIETPTLQHLWSPLYILNIIIIYIKHQRPYEHYFRKKKPLISYNKTLHGSVAMDLFNTPPPKKNPSLWVKQTIFVRVAKHPICSFVTCTPCNLLIKGVKKKRYFFSTLYLECMQCKFRRSVR